jgi:hypothetical protein
MRLTVLDIAGVYPGYRYDAAVQIRCTNNTSLVCLRLSPWALGRLFLGLASAEGIGMAGYGVSVAITAASCVD